MRRAFTSQAAVTPEGVRPATVLVEDGRIVAVTEVGDYPQDVEHLDFGSLHLLPGLVDTHVHINEPGRTEWEGFATATRAAAAGGFTTLIDMPLNSIPATTSVEGLDVKRRAAASRSHVDYGFWAGLVDNNEHEIGNLGASGVKGFKCFLVPSGVDEFPMVTPNTLRRAAPLIARTGLPLLAHAELPEALVMPTGDGRVYANYLASRPEASEVAAIRLLIDVCRQSGCRVHIVHLSSAEALPDLRNARAEGLPITVETCPHYLHFAAETIADGKTLYKCAPPVRSQDNRERLWQALIAGDIDLVATDHSPCPPELKKQEEGDFFRAWGGIASLSLALSVMWTEARERSVTIHRIAQWMSERPVQLAGLGKTKGRISPGYDADLVVFDPDASFTVTQDILHYRHPISAYMGETLRGAVRKTFLRSELVYSDRIFMQAGGKPI